MKSVNYITNLSYEEISGGGSGVNNAVVGQLKRKFGLNYIGPINLPVNKCDHLVSKMNRVLGFQGKYQFYSNGRLDKIAAKVQDRFEGDPADFNFFHHVTSWIKVKNDVPYFAYTDACFATYVEIFNRKEEFVDKDLNRIYGEEATFMKNANKIFFRSQWAMDETKKLYNLDGDNFQVVKFGGGIDEIPEKDKFTGGLKILFISKEFGSKGGYSVLKAFKLFNKLYPESELLIIGDKPKERIVHPKINFSGFINKSTKEGKAFFRKHLEEAFLLVHPTSKDTNTLVITEAAYYGCPTIASNKFAIPEFIENGKTGFLINNVNDEKEIVEKLKIMAENSKMYYKIRKNVRDKAMKCFTWEMAGQIMIDEIKRHLI